MKDDPLRHFARLSLERILDETIILNFRHLLERHELTTGGDRGL